jgi:hypothetical protein
VTQVWPKVTVKDQFNHMAECTRCKNNAGDVAFTRYVEQAINHGPYLCDHCLGYAQAIDDAVAVAKRNHDYDTQDQIAALKEATDATPNI